MEMPWMSLLVSSTTCTPSPALSGLTVSPYELERNGEMQTQKATDEGDKAAGFCPSSDAGSMDIQTAVPTVSTNNLVASRLLRSDQKFSTKTVQAFLDIINDPSFNKSSLTFRSFSDVYAYDAAERLQVASQRSCLGASPSNFHPLILANVIDIIESERRSIAEMHDTQHPSQVDSACLALAEISLVHRSWTWPAQKAMGRQIVISGKNVCELVRKAITSPLFGGWTSRAYICNTKERSITLGRRMRPRTVATYAKVENDAEFADLLIELVKRIPCLEELSLGLEWSPKLSEDARNKLYFRVLGQFASLKHLCTLELLHTQYQLPGSFSKYLARLISELHSLKSVCVKTWERPVLSAVPSAGDPQNSDAITGIRPPRWLSNLKIVVGRAVCIDFLTWLLSSGGLDGRTQIQKLELTLPCLPSDGSIYALSFTDDSSDDIGSLQSFAAAMIQSNALGYLRELRLCYEDDFMDPELIVFDILRSCTSLRILSISYRENINLGELLQCLPPTLTTLDYGLRLTDLQLEDSTSIKAFDSCFSNWISYTCASHSQLQCISLSPIHHVTRERLNQFMSVDQRAKINLRKAPMPWLIRVEETCRDWGVALKIRWRRVLGNSDKTTDEENLAFGSFVPTQFQDDMAGDTDESTEASDVDEDGSEISFE